MSSFLALLSPAKLLDDQTHYPNIACSTAEFTSEAELLHKKLRKLSAAQLSEMMDMSLALGQETQVRIAQWQLPFTHQNAHPAMLMFKGEVYRGLQAQELNRKQLDYAQNHFRILSGLYGILRPLDLVMPYRLMMGTRFEIDKKTPNLYAFWSEKITTHLDRELNKKATHINLASQEYFKCIDTKKLQRSIINCEFKEKKGNAFTTVNTYAKLARGLMARYIIDQSLKNATDIKSFDVAGYHFNASLSSETNYVFTR
jgi:hypothetical protein